MKNKNLEIAKEASEIKLEDMTGLITIEAAIKQAKRNLNRLYALSQIIKTMRGEDDD